MTRRTDPRWTRAERYVLCPLAALIAYADVIIRAIQARRDRARARDHWTRVNEEYCPATHPAPLGGTYLCTLPPHPAGTDHYAAGATRPGEPPLTWPNTGTEEDPQ